MQFLCIKCDNPLYIARTLETKIFAKNQAYISKIIMKCRYNYLHAIKATLS